MTRLAAAVFAAALTALSAVGIAAPRADASTVALTSPPMGWNSWNKFGCDINEDLIKQTADALANSALSGSGYRFVNIDDCWAAHDRDPKTGALLPDPQRFPHGIKALADYVHAKGLKLGIYSSAGTRTCSRYQPGSLDHERTDARSFAEWGVDYLKYDNCNNLGRPAQERFKAMGDALAAVDRPIVYAICEWGENAPWNWGAKFGGTMWRTTEDISDDWDSMTDILDQQVGLERYSGPGAWNDPDMLEVGNGGMTETEYRAHFTLWSLLNAPLLSGNDLRDMDRETFDILNNRALIAVNQDWAGVQGHKVRDDGDREVWAKPMSDGSVALVLFNRGQRASQISTEASEIGLPKTDSYRTRDLWTGKNGSGTGVFSAEVPSHGVVAYRVWPEPR